MRAVRPARVRGPRDTVAPGPVRRRGPPPREGRMPIAVGEVPAAENTALSVYIEVPLPGEADGCIYLVAAAIDEGEARMPDGENWKRAKIVRALMEKKGDRYVWRRWF